MGLTKTKLQEKGESYTYNAELHALYSSPNKNRNLKWTRLKWAGHVGAMEQFRNAYWVLVGKPEGNWLLGRPTDLVQNRDAWLAYTEWKGNKCHPFKSRRGRFKGHYIYIYTIWDLNLIVFSVKGVSSCILLRRTAYIVRDNAKQFTSVGLSYKDIILFSKIFYVFDVVYVKSNSISC